MTRGTLRRLLLSWINNNKKERFLGGVFPAERRNLVK